MPDERVIVPYSPGLATGTHVNPELTHPKLAPVVTVARTLSLPDGYRFAATLGQIAMGRYDPCARFVDGAFWWATTTPLEPATREATVAAVPTASATTTTMTVMAVLRAT